MKPFLILQLRPEDAAADNEFELFLQSGGLFEKQTIRIRMERENIPPIKLDEISGVIVGGGPFDVSEKNKSSEQLRFEKQLSGLLDEIIKRDFPFFGACYGIGFLTHLLGGKVSKEKYSESVGAVTIRLNEKAKKDPLLKNISPSFRAFVGHKEACQNLGEGCVLLGGSETCPIQIVKLKNNIYASQFHPEVDSDGLALRINIYRNAGYFHPEEADRLIALAAKENVTEPEKIFKNFIDLYKKF